jgi:vacuolar-type H+-ATPase subunit H
MLENKNKNAKEFNLFVIDIAKENQNILENNKKEIKKIFIELIKTLQEYIKRIKGLSEEKSNQFYMEDFNLSLTTDIKEVNPFFIE